MRKRMLLTVLIPLTYFAFLPLVLATAGRPGFSFFLLIVVGLILSIAGLGLWLGGMASLGKSFGVLPIRQVKVTRGLYQYVKHPIYWGIFLTFLGISISLGSVWGILYDVIIIGMICIVRARREEALLN